MIVRIQFDGAVTEDIDVALGNRTPAQLNRPMQMFHQPLNAGPGLILWEETLSDGSVYIANWNKVRSIQAILPRKDPNQPQLPLGTKP